MNTSITGTSSGLGKYLKKNIKGSVGVPRETNVFNEGFNNETIIIHCAFDSSNYVEPSYLTTFFDNNVKMTETLVKRPHKKFVFISTVDVYQGQKPQLFDEETLITCFNGKNLYATTKLMSEEIVRAQQPNHLILRLGGLLGESIRRNNLVRLMREEAAQLTLTASSTCNYLLHSQVKNVILELLRADAIGTFNLVSPEKCSYQTISDVYKKSPKFGQFDYQFPDICINKIRATIDFDGLCNTSIQNIGNFFERSF